MTIIGIIDYTGQAHCQEHMGSVSSYSHEVHDYSAYEAVCWCGDDLHTPIPAPEALPCGHGEIHRSTVTGECLRCCAETSAPEVEPDVIDELDDEEDELLMSQHEAFMASASAWVASVPGHACLKDCEQCGQHAVTRSVLWFEPNRHDDGYARICDTCWDDREITFEY